MKFASYDIVFQEIPNEITLAVNISDCPHRCKGCHSPHLQEDKGMPLNEDALRTFLAKYGAAITCVCFMGGDAEPEEVEKLSIFVRGETANRIKTAWYSGKAEFPESCSVASFDYIKTGPYMMHFGGLDSPDTNQRFYCVENGELIDRTLLFQKKSTNCC
ncbi:MAG: anaerobic ribonucleoside-triphosphate reductase activating protein [Prevotellaceae bacterium]|jgi:anaerobic ribonucleoside-triphosphate reductase activating protein|nr:anaerobic ribonucleoside-triphosphate reductase activating protein [Prevotellaceae bacterium]